MFNISQYVKMENQHFIYDFRNNKKIILFWIEKKII